MAWVGIGMHLPATTAAEPWAMQPSAADTQGGTVAMPDPLQPLLHDVAFLQETPGGRYLPGRNPRDLDGAPLAGDDDPDRDAPRAWTRFLARAFSDPVDPRTSLAEPDIREPGPDTADFPNSPYTLPRGWNYLEMSPVNYTAAIATLQTAGYNWNYLLRLGLTDRVELRLFGNGLSWQAAGLGQPETTGFAPLVFDTKVHFFDENPDYFVPATGIEVYVQTPWGSPAFDAGTQPGIMMLFLNTLPWGIEVNWNVGIIGDQAAADVGAVRFTDAVQWSFTKGVTDRLAVFIQGFKNQAALPRTANQTVLGGGAVLNLNRRFTVFGSFNAATDRAGPASTYYLGGAGAF